MSIRVSVGGVDRKTLNEAGVTVTRTYNERAKATVAFASGYTPTQLEEITIYENDGVTPMFGGLVHDMDAGRLHGEGPLVYVVECVDWWAFLDWCLVNGGYVGQPVPILFSTAPNTVVTSQNHNFITGDVVIIADHPGFSGIGYTITRINDNTFTVPISIPGGGNTGYCARSQNVSLKRVLSDLVVYFLSAYGITLDAAQEDGPTGTHVGLQWRNKFASDVIRDLTSLTQLGTGIGWVARISPTKVLRMVNPTLAVETAPYQITNLNERSHSIKWSRSAGEYGNRVVLKCGKDQTAETTETIVVNATHAAQLYIDMFAASTPTAGVTATRNGTPISIGGSGSFLTWTWNGGLDGRARITAGTGTLSLGDILVVTFTAQYPFYVEDDTGATPVVTRYYEQPDITDPIAANAMLAGLLAKASVMPQEIEFETLTHGFAPGQVIGIVLDDLALNTRGFIFEVEAKAQEGHWLYTVKVNTAAINRTSLDTFRAFTASGGGVHSTFTGGVNTSVILTGTMQVPLGGSANQSQAPASGTWVDVVDPTFFVAKIDVTGAIVRLSIRARNAGVTVTARLWNVTAGSAAVTGADVTSTTEVTQTLTANLLTGNRYVLQVKNNASGEGIYCYGTLESP